MTRRTIIVLNDYCNINGGASHVAIDEAVGLAEAGEEVIFFGATGPVCTELKKARLKVICLGQPELIDVARHPGVLFQGIWNFAAYRRMSALLRDLDPQHTIIHLHGYTKALTTSPVRAATKKGFSVVCTLHDYFTACPNGAFFDYVERKTCLRRGLSLQCITANCDKRHYAHKLFRVVRAVVQRYIGRLPKSVHNYINLSRLSIKVLDSYLPADARFHPLRNIINVAHSPPIDVAINDTIVAVGRLDIEKGIEILIEAARRSDIKLTLIGDGPLRSLAETLPKCRVTGWLKPEGVLKELEHARCLVLPSLWYEGLPLVVGEAASRGIPAIISDITTSTETVDDGVEGWHAKTGNIDDLVRCLDYTKDDAAVRKTGRAAYDRFWSDPPTREYHSTRLLAIYDTILADRKRKRQPESDS